ncbi:hypothetical protein TWF730_008691 [Orbilia blumenaviensis]|uniref:F-box domain-containing protein n=1 Tax=Orbilia blumenaviensis TaxID=1796055 RepID=A0AAV9V4Q4_9PEZI
MGGISLVDLPLDIKLDLLESLDSVASLRSILLTCHIFYDISQTRLWTRIYIKVLENDIGVAGQAVVKMRRFKARRTEVELIEAIPTIDDEKPGSANTYLRDLLSVRRPVRFFTRLFFRTRFENRRGKPFNKQTDALEEMKTITHSEYARVDEAYYTLWLYKELNYNVELRSLEQVAAVNNWAFWNNDGTPQIVPDVGILSHVLRVTSVGIVYPHVRKYGKTLSLQELHSISEVVEAICLYEKHGIASMLITQFGFDGLQKVLESTPEQIQKIISKIYWVPCEAAHQGITPLNSVTQFPSLITDFWKYIQPTYKGVMRRAWKRPGGKYRTRVAPWNQCSSFDITALVWDDDRLESWGYFYPAEIDSKEYERAYDMTLENQICTEDCSILGCSQWDPEAIFAYLGCGFGLAQVPMVEVIAFVNEVLTRSRHRIDESIL